MHKVWTNEIDDVFSSSLYMDNEREILFNSIATNKNIQPENDMFLRIMIARDIKVVKSLAQYICVCFKQIKCYKYWKVAFVIRRGGALLGISEMLSQLNFSMRSECFCSMATPMIIWY